MWGVQDHRVSLSSKLAHSEVGVTTNFALLIVNNWIERKLKAADVHKVDNDEGKKHTFDASVDAPNVQTTTVMS